MSKMKRHIPSEHNPDKMCRLCLVEDPAEEMIDIFESSEVSLTVKIMACAGLEVTKTDALPKQMCISCRLGLEQSFLFRNRCKNSDTKLRRHYRLVNAGKRSRVFDESDDECDEDYADSLKVICELQERIQPTKQFTAAEPNAKTKFVPANPSTSVATTSDSGHAKRSSSRIQQKVVIVRTEPDELLESNETIEILMEDADEQDCEYIIGDEHEFDVLDDLLDQSGLGVRSDEQIENVVCDTGSITGNDSDNVDNPLDSDADEEMIDEDDEMDYLDDDDFDDTGNDKILESLLPAIKKSVAEKSGTLLDDETQYKIIKRTGDEIRVQCIASDGKEFDIEMVSDGGLWGNDFERDDNGDWKIFKCSKCPKTFARRGKLINHERDHTAKQTGKECPFCQKWFPSKSTMQRHVRVHTGEKPFKCEICNRSFIQKEILKRHLMIHSGERPFKCDYCDRTFILRDALRQHVNRNHSTNPQQDSHDCPFCSKTFCHSSGLSRHLLIHAGRTFACDYCHKKFNDKSALKRHTISIHNVSVDAKQKNISKK